MTLTNTCLFFNFISNNNKLYFCLLFYSVLSRHGNYAQLGAINAEDDAYLLFQSIHNVHCSHAYIYNLPLAQRTESTLSDHTSTPQAHLQSLFSLANSTKTPRLRLQCSETGSTLIMHVRYCT